MDVKTLILFGLTETEAKVLLELIHLNKTSIGEIIKRTGLHRGTVYNVLQQLLKKGFIGFINRKDIKYYFPSGTKIFEESISREEARLKKQKEKLKDINELMSSFKLKDEKPEVKVLSSNISFKSFFKELLDWAHKTKNEYLFFGKGNEIIEFLGLNYYKTTQTRKKKLKIKCRAILNRISLDLPVSKYIVADVKYQNMKYPSLVSTWIYGNKVAIVLWGSKPLLIIIIESKGVAESYKNFFESLWKTEIEEITSKKDYVLNLIEGIKNNKSFKIINREKTVPFFLYPINKMKFIKLRNYIKNKRKTVTDTKYDLNFKFLKEMHKQYKTKKVKYIMEKDGQVFFLNALSSVFGKNEAKNYIKKIKKKLDKYGIKIKVVKTHNQINTCVTENDVSTIIPVSSELVNGFVTTNKQVVKFYDNLFDNIFKQGTDINIYFDRFLK